MKLAITFVVQDIYFFTPFNLMLTSTVCDLRFFCYVCGGHLKVQLGEDLNYQIMNLVFVCLYYFYAG